MLLYNELFKYEYFRLSRIVIDSYKSIGHGEIEFKSNKDDSHSDNIICLYGANGAGKTSVAEIILLFKTLAKGNQIDQKIYGNCISVGSENAHILYEFEGFLKDESTGTEYKRQLAYEFDLVKNTYNDKITVKNEILRVANIERKDSKDKALLQLQPIFDTTESEQVGERKLPFGPKSKITQLVEGEDYHPLHAIKKDSFDSSRSFLFNKDTLHYLIGHNYFGRVIKEDEPIFRSFRLNTSQLSIFARKIEAIASDRFNNQVCIFYGSIFELARYGEKCINVIGYNGLTPEFVIDGYKLNENEEHKLYPIRSIKAFAQHIDKINGVLPFILPDTIIDIKIIEKSSEKAEVVLLINDGTIQLPISLASDGIKKTICIISALISSECKDGYLTVIDDLDSNVFTPALTELIRYIDSLKDGRQFIFTMHNPITMDDVAKESVVFTTTDRNNRFARAKLVKACNSLMKLYLGSNPKISPNVEFFKPTGNAKTENLVL